MYWQCRNFFASEDGTLQVHRLSLMWWNMERPFDMSAPKLSHSLWRHLVTDYSLRRLTYATDRGPAIAGLVEFYRKHTGHTPLLGLWKESLCFDLCWELVSRKSAYLVAAFEDLERPGTCKQAPVRGGIILLTLTRATPNC